MPRNVEIKARLKDATATKALVERAASSGPFVLYQADTFFAVAHGRLKLREIDGADAELIWYDRPDTLAPKESRYTIARIVDPALTREALAAAVGVRVVVRKRRALYLVDQTRVHLDEVDGLGSFLELEVVLRSDQSVDEGTAIAHDLLRRFEVSPDQLVAGAYADLLEATPMRGQI